MMNRRQLASRLAAWFAAAVAVEARPKAVKPPEPKVIAIAMRFEFQGGHYGLAVPILDPTFKDIRRPHGLGVLEVIDGRQTVTLDDTEMKILIQMLQDLRWSMTESIRMLHAGEKLG